MRPPRRDVYVSAINREVPVAAPGEFPQLAIGPLKIWPPVVLAPMAGVTNAPFRDLCRRYGAGLYVSEMIAARPLVDGNRKTLDLAGFGPEENPRSLQLYGADPHYVALAVQRLVAEGRVDHIDMNFGCPVPKVTRKGGGAAIPVKPKLLARIVQAAVSNAGSVPVTIKFRMGIDDELLTFRDAGRVGQEEGCAAIALHARTAAQLYDGEARWAAIAELKSLVTRIPVLGNGDIWEAEDALRMMRTTSCDGVVVGRGCLGRPWLFRDLADVFSGRPPSDPPGSTEIKSIMEHHARALVAWFGERIGMLNFRRHLSWYTKGFPTGATVRARLSQLDTLADLEELIRTIPDGHPFPPWAARLTRGKGRGTQRVALPDRYLESRDDDTAPSDPGADSDGG